MRIIMLIGLCCHFCACVLSIIDGNYSAAVAWGLLFLNTLKDQI